MSATAKSRIAPMYYDTPPKALPPLPKTPAERRQAMADAVFASVQALQRLLNDRDPHVVMKAAGMILDVDKTQIRHGRNVSGADDPSPFDPLPGMPGYESPYKSAPSERPAAPLPTPEKMAQMRRMIDADDDDDDGDEFDDDLFGDGEEPEPKKANVADPMVAYIENIRAQLQRQADEEGTGEVISWKKAELIAQKVAERRKQLEAEATAHGRPRSSGPSSQSSCGVKSPGPI